MATDLEDSDYDTFYESDPFPVVDPDRTTLLEQKVEELYQALQIIERTLYGVQQMLMKAAEYKGKPRGRLPR